MKKTLIATLLLSATIGCANSNETRKSPTTTNESQKTETEMKQNNWLVEFENAFNAGDAKTIASLFTDNGSWTLANGSLMEARDLESGLNAAFKEGAGSLKISDVQRYASSEGELVRHEFSFKVGEFEIAGKRSIWTQQGKIVRDIWVPKAIADADSVEKVRLATAALDDAFNNNQPQKAAGLYSEKSTLVLTTGKTIMNSDVQPFIANATPTVSEMRSEIGTVYKVGPNHFASESSFSGKLTLGEKIILLAGNRLVLWEVVEGNLKIASEISWPLKKN